LNPTALVPLAPGCEELEAVAIIDVLRRADVEVTVAVVPADGQGQDLTITASRGVRLVGDCLLADCRDRQFDVIVLPGGMPGAEHLRDSKMLCEMLVEQDQRAGLVAAICASPAVVLAPLDLIRDRWATCYPSFMDQLPATSRSGERVLAMANLITSRGPGTALEFALTLVECLRGADKSDELASQLLMP
jgi:4-methyl-5(b-hydroxyethyl)-thiazole monophosphate biosynthesis